MPRFFAVAASIAKRPAQLDASHVGAASSAADLLRPSAEEASPDDAIPDVLCHPAVLPRELHFSRVRRCSPLLSERSRFPPRQGPVTHALFKGMRSRPRTPSIGLTLNLAAEWTYSRSLDRSRALARHPFRPIRTCASGQTEERPCRATLLDALDLSACCAKRGKMLLTDFCNRLTTRAPEDRPIPSRPTFAGRDQLRVSPLRRRRARLAAHPASSGVALNGALPTSAAPFTAPFRAQAHLTWTALPRRFRPRAKVRADL
jgi:hypothetical protein